MEEIRLLWFDFELLSWCWTSRLRKDTHVESMWHHCIPGEGHVMSVESARSATAVKAVRAWLQCLTRSLGPQTVIQSLTERPADHRASDLINGPIHQRLHTLLIALGSEDSSQRRGLVKGSRSVGGAFLEAVSWGSLSFSFLSARQ